MANSTNRQTNRETSLGPRLSDARRVTGDSQSRVARWVTQRTGLKIGQSAISGYERGKIQKPSARVQRALEEYCRDAELTAALSAPSSRGDSDAAFQAIVAPLTNEPVTGDKQAELVRTLFHQLRTSEPLTPQRAAILNHLAKFLGTGDLSIPAPDGTTSRALSAQSTAALVAFFRGAGAALDAAADGGDPQTALRALRQLHRRAMDAMVMEVFADAGFVE